MTIPTAVVLKDGSQPLCSSWFCEYPCAFKVLLLLVPKCWGSSPLTSWLLSTYLAIEYLPNSKLHGNEQMKESYWDFLCLPSPVQIYTHLLWLFASNRNYWSETTLNNRILVTVLNCTFHGMFELGSLLLGILIGIQRYCPRNWEGSTPIQLWEPCNIKARCSLPAGLCVQKEVRWYSQATPKSFLSLNLHKEVENFCIVCSIWRTVGYVSYPSVQLVPKLIHGNSLHILNREK